MTLSEQLEALDAKATVTPADRSAAAAYLRKNEKVWIARNTAIMQREADNDPLVQAFARHRIAALRLVESSSVDAQRIAELERIGEAQQAELMDVALRAQELEAENARLREALRACKRATLHGAEEPRANVRFIVEETLHSLKGGTDA